MAGLFDPFAIKGLTLKNRIVMPPMANNLANRGGDVSERHIDHYTARAEANVGLVMVEHAYVRRNGRTGDTQLGAWDDSLVSGLRKLALFIQSAGAAAGIQLNHLGSRASCEAIGEQPVSPSGVRAPNDLDASRPLTVDEIGELVLAFAAAARRAAEAGFDVIEIHGAHGFLLNQFLSPYTNRRSDRYGGDLEGRLTFAREIIAAVRKTIGHDYPLFYRLGADDFTPGGLTLADGQETAKRLVEAGIDVVDVSGGLCGSRPERFTGRGFFVPLAEGVRKATGAPVIGVGNIREPEYADELVRRRRVDLVAVGRALLADPEWARKAAERLGVKLVGP